MQVFKPKEFDKEILRLIDKGMIQSVIAKRLGRSPPIINQHIKRLINHEYLTKEIKDAILILKLTAKAYKLLAEEHRKNSNTLTQTRTESYRLKYPLKDKLNAKEPAAVLQQAGFETELQGLKNSERVRFQLGQVTAFLNTASLELFCPHLYSTSDVPSIVIEAEAKTILDRLALDMEERLNRFIKFRLVRLDKDTLYSIRLDVEYAEEEHIMAQQKPKQFKFEVHHPEDQRLRAKIDYSRGREKPEFEFTHRLTAPADRDTTNAQFNALFDGRINLLDIPDLKQIAWEQEARLEGLMVEREKMLVQDMALRKDIKKHLKMLDEKMEEIYNKNRQRKLP